MPSIPNVAIVSFREINDFQESWLIKEEFAKNAVPAYIVDAREFTFSDNILYYNGIRIDMIYNETSVQQIIKEQDSCKAYMNAIRNNAACGINIFKGIIIDDKNFFAVLYDKKFKDLFTKEDKQFIDDYIPFTKSLEKLDNSYDDIFKNKNNYILKTQDSFKGKGVFVGKHMTVNEWEKLLYASQNKHCIIQEFIRTDVEPYPYITDRRIVTDDFRITIGLFAHCNKLAGLYSRASKEDIINADGENDYYLGNMQFKPIL